MVLMEKKMFGNDRAVEFFVRNLVGDVKVSDPFVDRMIPMIKAIFCNGVNDEHRPRLMQIAVKNILRRALIEEASENASA